MQTTDVNIYMYVYMYISIWKLPFVKRLSIALPPLAMHPGVWTAPLLQYMIKRLRNITFFRKTGSHPGLNRGPLT